MANEDLQAFADQLSNDFDSESGLWSDLGDVVADLKGEFTEDDRKTFAECTNDGDFDGFDTLAACLESKADELGIAGNFRRTIARETELLEGLKSAGKKAARDHNVSKAVRSLIDANNLSKLNRMCSAGSFSAVEDQADMDAVEELTGVSSIDSYQDCVTVTAEIEELSSKLKRGYDTA